MAAVLENMLSRQFARFHSQPVETTLRDGDDEYDAEEERPSAVVGEDPASPTLGGSSVTPTPPRLSSLPFGVSIPTTTTTTTTTTTLPLDASAAAPPSTSVPLGGHSTAAATTAATAAAAAVTTTTMTLAELEEERDLARRRTSACVLLAVFVLFRMWIQAIQDGDFGLLLVCLVGTSWTARWVRYNRDREEELDHRIASYLENGTGESGASELIDRNDLRMLSFQAQLALAIMESQRLMMQGGYGHPDGLEAANGVSAQARAQWEHFAYKSGLMDSPGKPQKRKGGYGSLSQKTDGASTAPASAPASGKNGYDDGPHCSICLCEYEDGDNLVRLPCSHVYHDECISSWTSNHVKCPLCNFDLESVPTTTADASSAGGDDSIV